MLYLLIGFFVVLLMAVILFLVVSVSLQEANDPLESNPEDLSEFEKRHVHRTDIFPHARA